MTQTRVSLSGSRVATRRGRAGAAVAVLALCAGSLAACGSSAKSSSTSSSTKAPSSSAAEASVQMWIAGNSITKPIYTAEAAAYSKAHHVSVTLTDLPGPAYTQKLDAALAAGKPPSIFQVFSPGPQMETLVANHQLANLSDLVSTSSPLRTRILPSALAQGQLDGKQYGIPYNVFQEAVILYSKPDFKKAGISGPPTSWSQMATDVAKLRKIGVIPISISGTESDNWYGWWLENYEVRLAGLGVSKSLQKGDFKALGSTPVIEAATAMQELVKSGAFEPGYSTTSEADDVPYALLGTGKAAMLLYGAFTPDFVESVSPSFVRDGQMGWFSFPTVQGGASDVIDLGSQPQLVVNAKQSKADVAASKAFLASWVYTPAQDEALARSGNVGPEANASGLVEKYAPGYLKNYMEFELSEASTAKASFLGWGQFIPTSQTDTWDSLKESLFTLKISPKAFAQQAAKL